MAIADWINSLASTARPPVFCLIGEGGRERARELHLNRRVQIAASPRHATVLLVVGEPPAELERSARQTHDQVPEPRGVVIWGEAGRSWFPDAPRVSAAADPAEKIVEVHRDLLRGTRASSPLFGPSENPVAWKGVGPHGQGGEGMMGGKPYGRAMAMTAEDIRDGLQLDQLELTAGPYLPWMPAGLRFTAQLQGDVIQSLEWKVPSLRRRDMAEVFHRAEVEETPIAEIEIARARHHLGATADLLFLVGLSSLAERLLLAARDAGPATIGRVRQIESALRRSGALKPATRGVGALEPSALEGGGLVARAAGRSDDARMSDPAYRALGFSPIVSAGGDAEARWRQRLLEASQSLELAGRAGKTKRTPSAPLEGPRSVLGSGRGPDWLEILSRFARGRAWDDFVTTLVSLDLDPASLPITGAYDPSEEDAEGENETSHDEEAHG